MLEIAVVECFIQSSRSTGSQQFEQDLAGLPELANFNTLFEAFHIFTKRPNLKSHKIKPYSETNLKIVDMLLHHLKFSNLYANTLV